MLIWLFRKVLPPKFRANAENINSTIAGPSSEAEADRKLATPSSASLAWKKRFAARGKRKDAAAEAERIRALANRRGEVAISAKLKSKLRNAPHALDQDPRGKAGR